MSEERYISIIKDWIENFVLRHELCPFAEKPFSQNQIGYTVVLENHMIPIANQVMEESLKVLDESKNTTSFVVLPNLKMKFADFYAFSQELTERCASLDIPVRLIAFHPNFHYEGESPQHASNATNQSPFPMIHILTLESLEQIETHHINVAEWTERNRRKLSSLGKSHALALHHEEE